MLQRCRPQAEKIWEILSAIHLKLCGFFDGDGRYEGLCQPVLCLVCQQQERGTLLSQLPRRSRPAIALRHSTASKILLPCLFPFFFGGSGLVLGIELSVQYGVKLLFQALPDFFVKIVLAVQMLEHQINKQIIGYLYTFHSILSFL